LVGCGFSYAVYPLVMLAVPRRRAIRTPTFDVIQRPPVTMIIACRNERRRLAAKLDNALAVRYEPFELLVASDASDDGSDDIVRDYSDKGVRLVRSAERRGKEHAQRLAVTQSLGDIIVFSDAGTDTPPDSICAIVAPFADPRVGAVSSEDRFVSDDGKIVGEGAYVRYEMWLRRLESGAGGLVGLSGSFFAVRRALALSLDDEVPSDFACAINARRLGLIAMTEPTVHGIYRNIKDSEREFERKVRTALRGMAAIAKYSEVLNPIRYGMFAFQIWGHKVLRWLVPWFMIGLLASSALLATSSRTFTALTIAQVAAYGIATCAHYWPGSRRVGLIRLGYYFCQANAALWLAGVQFVNGRRVRVWDPSVR
jgi:hypothetical protein